MIPRIQAWQQAIATVLFALLIVRAPTLEAATVIDFESLTVPFNSNDASTGPFEVTGTRDNFGEVEQLSFFSAGGATFDNAYTAAFGSWAGFAPSRRSLPVWSSGEDGAGGLREFSDNNDTVSVSGSGANGSDTWLAAFGSDAVIEAPVGHHFESLLVNNTATTAHVIRNGNRFTDPFGSRPQDEEFSVAIVDLTTGQPANEVTQILASYTVSTNTTFVMEDWTLVDLSSLGNPTRIGLRFETTDEGTFGPNTPLYAAIDNVVVAVPEPTGIAGLAFLTAFGVCRRIRRREHASINHSGNDFG